MKINDHLSLKGVKEAFGIRLSPGWQLGGSLLTDPGAHWTCTACDVDCYSTVWLTVQWCLPAAIVLLRVVVLRGLLQSDSTR